ncbi:MAG TPA: M20 family metallopeptidase [Cryomorphaceae bacterium]|nr:M20 family metallopeptidase [Cryomorphaceae bacterium]
MLTNTPINELRERLHQFPELSEMEGKTADFIARFFTELNYEIKREIGFHGLIASKKFGSGKTIAFRAELDALPINEETDKPYKSQNEGVSHSCGHDGHMATLLNLAMRFESEKDLSGKVVFIFQSAEENGQGAEQMIQHEEIKNLDVAHCFSLHNIPGEAMGSVIYKKGSFSCASVGIDLKIKGKSSHAAHPEFGINALTIASDALRKIQKIHSKYPEDEFTMITPIALKSGKRAFGTVPSDATLLVTIRAEKSEILEGMMNSVREIVDKLQADYKAKLKLSFKEYFPDTVNFDDEGMLKDICVENNTQYVEMSRPFPWSEDFGFFRKCFPILMFGLGSGQSQPHLHAANFDFPNELIEKGSDIFFRLYNRSQ